MERFKVLSEKVVYQDADDEIVIIHLKSGNYFSLDKAGAHIWRLLEKGANEAEIVESCLACYKGDHDIVQKTVEQITSDLQKNELIVLRSNDDDKLSIVFPEPAEKEKSVFGTPKLEGFTDMQELLLLDPIHDTDDVGWPVRAPEA